MVAESCCGEAFLGDREVGQKLLEDDLRKMGQPWMDYLAVAANVVRFVQQIFAPNLF